MSQASSPRNTSSDECTIPSRSHFSFEVPIKYAGDMFQITWSLTSHDILLIITFTPATDNGMIQNLHSTKYISNDAKEQSYSYTVQCKGTLTIKFDNRHSLLRSKSVKWKYNIKSNLLLGTIHNVSPYGIATLIGRHDDIYICDFRWGRGYVHINAFNRSELEPLTTVNQRAMVGSRLFFCNENDLAESFYQDELANSVIFSVAYCLIGHIRALMTFERADIDIANERLTFAQNLCSERLPSESTLSSVSRMLTSSSVPDKPNLSPENLEMTLINAETYILQAQLLLTEESVVSIIKAGLKVRSCWQLLDKCDKELQSYRKNGMENKIDPSVVAGIQFEIGIFNAIISILPPSVLRILSFLGYPASRAKGFEMLNIAFQSNTLRSPLASLALLFLHVIVPSFFTVHMTLHLSSAEVIVKRCFELFPNGALFLWIDGRMKRNSRDVQGAVKSFRKSAMAQPSWQQLQSLCDYELGWCHFFLLEFSVSKKYWHQLYEENSWSKAFFLYMEAIATIDCLWVEKLSCDQSECDNLSNQYFEKIEAECQRKLAGKSLSIEQFILQRTNDWVKRKNRLFLPTIEFIYIFNGFSQMIDAHLLMCLDRVINSLKDESLSHDRICLAKLLQCAILRNLGRLDEALEVSTDFPQSDSNLSKDERWIIPFGRFEHATTLFEILVKKTDVLSLNEQERKKITKPIREAFRHCDSYNQDFRFQHRLQVRVHLAVCELKRLRRGESESEGGSANFMSPTSPEI